MWGARPDCLSFCKGGGCHSMPACPRVACPPCERTGPSHTCALLRLLLSLAASIKGHRCNLTHPVQGGECNYLLRVTPVDKRLEFVPDLVRRWGQWDADERLHGGVHARSPQIPWPLAAPPSPSPSPPPSLPVCFTLSMKGRATRRTRVVVCARACLYAHTQDWKTGEMLMWHEKDIQAMLDSAEALLTQGAQRLSLSVQHFRKPRSVGIVPTTTTIYEVRGGGRRTNRHMHERRLGQRGGVHERANQCVWGGGACKGKRWGAPAKAPAIAWGADHRWKHSSLSGGAAALYVWGLQGWPGA